MCGCRLPAATAQARAEGMPRQCTPKPIHALELAQRGHVHHFQGRLPRIRSGWHSRERGLPQRCEWCGGAGHAELLRRLVAFWQKRRLSECRLELGAIKVATRAKQRTELVSILAVDPGSDDRLIVLEQHRGIQKQGALDVFHELQQRMLIRTRRQWIAGHLRHANQRAKRRGCDNGHRIHAVLGAGIVHEILQMTSESSHLARHRDLFSVSRSHADWLIITCGLLRRGRLF
ncbi:hypothetical protein Ctob_009068, partial [Chrysochromulina tobinii]